MNRAFFICRLPSKTDSTHFWRRFRGSGHEDLFKIQFAVPKLLREQCAIAERFESARREIAAEERVLEKLMSLRAGLMQDLLTGRKRVTALLAKGAVPEVAHAAQ